MKSLRLGSAATLALVAASCTRPAAQTERSGAPPAAASPAAFDSAAAATQSRPAASAGAGEPVEVLGDNFGSFLANPGPLRDIGPFELPFAKGRTVYVAVPAARGAPRRLIANLHGMCNPPGYACGYWLNAGAERGFVVCPTGNATCGAGASAPPTWTSGPAQMADDLERAVAAVAAAYPGEIAPGGAVLTGFSKGGYAAPAIAARNPGRFPYLLINEADVALDAASLRRAGVRAVALVAGEYGSQLAGERRTANRLAAQGFPARLWVMPKAGHHYSANIDAIMAEALDWLASHDASELREPRFVSRARGEASGASARAHVQKAAGPAAHARLRARVAALLAAARRADHGGAQQGEGVRRSADGGRGRGPRPGERKGIGGGG